MISYATRADLLGFANERTRAQQSSLRESAETRSPAGTTFLSHSTKDQDLVVGAIRLLEGHGGTVYIDKKDPTLPPYTSQETARGLKTRIGQARKFVLLASPNSKDSRWVPWELGLADGYKGMDKVAILPAVDAQNDTSWTNWEYLGLYDRIVWGDHQEYDAKIWMVLDKRANEATELSRWLAK
ncbi:toll/interleukin-1 receptor domain-containing protein [Sphingomonas aurantiaca]|uniref:toll/interleukin-1 receptor domain-containing protein n=1 Tax=Sphingomonas aurantiaca TaxID=185949 RepID=UPI0033568184